jgi:hypothetical protein
MNEDDRTDLKKLQQNPDGLEGHLELELIYESLRGKPKKKFTGGTRHHPPKEDSFEQIRLKEQCEHYKPGCTVNNCSKCRHKGNLMNTLFENRSVGKIITIDLDVFFWSFVRPLEEVPENDRPGLTLNAIRIRLARLEKRVGLVIPASYRRSSGGHVHVRLSMPCEVSVLDAFLIRAWLFDDKTRLQLDEARYLMTGSLHEMNRCFDIKATVKGVNSSGPWIPLDVDRDQFTGNVLEDYRDYLVKRVNDRQQQLAERGK